MITSDHRRTRYKGESATSWERESKVAHRRQWFEDTLKRYLYPRRRDSVTHPAWRQLCRTTVSKLVDSTIWQKIILNDSEHCFASQTYWLVVKSELHTAVCSWLRWPSRAHQRHWTRKTKQVLQFKSQWKLQDWTHHCLEGGNARVEQVPIRLVNNRLTWAS